MSGTEDSNQDDLGLILYYWNYLETVYNKYSKQKCKQVAVCKSIKTI